MSVEEPRQFVDTNVVVYAHDTTAGTKHIRARELLERLWESRGGCLSVQVLQEAYVTLTHKVPVPLQASAAVVIIEDLSRWRIHTPDPDDVLRAIELHRRHRLSFWDAMILWSASRLGCDVLWSEDLEPDRIYDNVRVRNPFTTR